MKIDLHTSIAGIGFSYSVGIHDIDDKIALALLNSNKGMAFPVKEQAETASLAGESTATTNQTSKKKRRKKSAKAE